jgi:glycosyltransferase involved in cell wall biosynthesis
VDLGALAACHAVIVPRGISARALSVLRAARLAGCRTLYDSDDNLLLVHEAISDPDNPWRRIFGEARPHIEAMLAEADAVKVYTAAAVPFFRRHNPCVAFIPPYQSVDEPLPPAREQGPVTVGFMGSYFKDEEFVPVVPAIERLIAEGHPLRFEFFGFLPAALAGSPAVTHVPWISSYLDFRRRLQELRWDVGLAPLRDREFHRAKTNIKYREYAAAGIAGVYSDAAAYRDSVRDGVTGLLVPHDDERAWHDAILRLGRDAALRTSIRRNAYEDVTARYRIEDYVTRVAALLEGDWPPPAARG